VYDLLTARKQRREGETPAARLARVRQADAAYPIAAQQLSRMLLDQAAGYLEHKRLLIVAEGVLKYLPFGALPEPGTNAPLIMNHEIATAPSASVVALLRQQTAGRKPASKLLAVLADPVFHADDPRIAAPNTSVSGPCLLGTCRTSPGYASAGPKPRRSRGWPVLQPRLRRLTSTPAARPP